MKAAVDIVTITPKKAAEYLENLLADQRNVREGWVKSLAEDMRAGRFRLSCDCIVLVNGKLANGQHRLWAVVESNTPQPFILMRTDDEELYKVLDCGKSRSVADVVHVAAAGQCAAVGNLALGYQRKYLTPLSWKKKNSRVELINFVEANVEKLNRAVRIASCLTHNHQNLIAKSATAAFEFLCEQMHGQRSEEFLNHVYSGDLQESVCWTLRERFTKARLDSQLPMPPQMGLALFIKAFNSHYTGIKVTKFGMRMTDGELYPEIVKPTKE